MNREIKFRGKRKDNGEWIYGYYAKDYKNSLIIVIGEKALYNLHIPHQVIPESVGQYTGLKDKNGKEIYEGDIIKCKYGKATIESIEDIHQSLGWRDKKENSKCSDIGRTIEKFKNEIEIIGNIYENKELLK